MARPFLGSIAPNQLAVARCTERILHQAQQQHLLDWWCALQAPKILRLRLPDAKFLSPRVRTSRERVGRTAAPSGVVHRSRPTDRRIPTSGYRIARTRPRLADIKAAWLARWVWYASDEQLERVMRSRVRRILLWQIFRTMRQRFDAERAAGVDAVVEFRIRADQSVA
jgi:hypothetical protein